MILTTTDTIQGKNITEYLGLVGSVALTVLPGSNRIMGEYVNGSIATLQKDLTARAEKMGADAVVGIKIVIHKHDNFILMGTAVKLD